MNANQEIIAELRRVLGERDDARSTIEDLNDEIARGREAIRIYRTETEAAKRERDQARMAEERARESLEELDEAIYDCLPCDDDESPLDCVERAGDRIHALIKERDEARREADRLRHGNTIEGDFVCPHEQAYTEARASRWHAIKERDEARAEVERLRGILPEPPPRAPDGHGLPRYGLRWNGPSEPASVPMADGYWTPWHLASDAYRRGAEAMREACIGYAHKIGFHGLTVDIRTLPIPEEP